MSRDVPAPMLPFLAGDVTHALSDVPTLYRAGLRAMVRDATARAWSDGYAAGHTDASQDAFDRRAEDATARKADHPPLTLTVAADGPVPTECTNDLLAVLGRAGFVVLNLTRTEPTEADA